MAKSESVTGVMCGTSRRRRVHFAMTEIAFPHEPHILFFTSLIFITVKMLISNIGHHRYFSTVYLIRPNTREFVIYQL